MRLRAVLLVIMGLRPKPRAAPYRGSAPGPRRALEDSSARPRRRARGFILAPLLSLLSCAGELPAPIREEIATTQRANKSAVTVVFFTDFECPFCRRTHLALAPLLEERRGRVRVVLRHVPLARHPDARTAARAAICVETLTRPLLDDYSHALFESNDLSEAACEALAVERGVDKDRYQRCLSDPSTDARIDRDVAMFEEIKGDGVPLLYVGRSRLEGAQSREALAAALDEALGAK
jgi:predicted DsbA family dithiol-disulfide isomerase